MQGATVRAADLPKVRRLTRYGFQLKEKPQRSGNTYVTITKDPRFPDETGETAEGK